MLQHNFILSFFNKTSILQNHQQTLIMEHRLLFDFISQDKWLSSIARQRCATCNAPAIPAVASSIAWQPIPFAAVSAPKRFVSLKLLSSKKSQPFLLSSELGEIIQWTKLCALKRRMTSHGRLKYSSLDNCIIILRVAISTYNAEDWI